MKITLEIPEWATERRITILAGVELVAQKLPWSDWKVKKVRCDKCGQCCMQFKPNSNQTPFGVDDEGKCKALKLDHGQWICQGLQQFLSCLQDPINEPECCIVREVKS